MKTNTLLPLLFAAILGGSCGVLKEVPDEEPAPPVVEPPAVEPPAAEPPAAEPEDKNYVQRFIDGRIMTSDLPKEPSMEASAVLSWAHSPIPDAERIGPTQATVRPGGGPDSLPVSQVEEPLAAVLLEGGNPQLESHLLAAGLKVADRGLLPAIQREFFLQDAFTEEMGERAPIPAGEDPRPAPRLVGLDAYDLVRLWWMSGSGGFRPLLNGSAIPAAGKLDRGKIFPAQAILDLSEVDYQVVDHDLPVDQPTAEWIGYRPAVMPGPGWEELRDVRWTPAADDPFRLRARAGTTYFDPVKGALWSFDEARWSAEVSRADYLSRRSGVDPEFCAGCARELDGKPYGPDPDQHPEKWFCPECEASYDVRYYDGYFDNHTRGDVGALIAHWRWQALRPGVYPVLTPGNVEGSSHTPFYFPSGTWSEGLEPLTATEELLPSVGRVWAWVRSDGSAVLLPEEDLDRLWSETSDGLLPVVDAAGEQVFLLERERHRAARFDLPVVHGRAVARMVTCEEARVILAGALEMSYLDLLDAPVRLEATSSGVDLGAWPGVAEQRAALEAEMMRRLAGLVTTR